MTDERIPIVYIDSEDTIGVVISYGAHVSKINYTKRGLEFEEYIPNEELTILGYINDYEVNR